MIDGTMRGGAVETTLVDTEYRSCESAQRESLTSGFFDPSRKRTWSATPSSVASAR
jgi:hypothetical protein